MSERQRDKNTDKNVTSVIDQLRDREQAGLNKYGTNTERTDLDTLEWLQHLQEELMDGAVYIERLKGDVKELLRLSTEPSKDREKSNPSVTEENTIMGSKEFDEWPRDDFSEEQKYGSTPQHVKIPTDDY
jgi:hypothetical protein